MKPPARFDNLSTSIYPTNPDQSTTMIDPDLRCHLTRGQSAWSRSAAHTAELGRKIPSLRFAGKVVGKKSKNIPQMVVKNGVAPGIDQAWEFLTTEIFFGKDVAERPPNRCVGPCPKTL